MQLPLGTIVNVLAVIVGSGLGMLLHRGFPERFRTILLTAGGLATLALGAQMAIQTGNPLVLIGSLYLGALCGEALGIETWLERVGERIKRAGESFGAADRRSAYGSTLGSANDLASSDFRLPISTSSPDSSSHEGNISGLAVRYPEHQFTHGLVTAFLIFCVGPMTILGALNEGISGDHTLLFVKSGLDLVTSFVLASSFGSGVLFSAIPLVVFQLAITALGALIGKAFSDELVTELTAVGGALIIGLGLNLLGIANLRVANLLPALAVVVLIMLFL